MRYEHSDGSFGRTSTRARAFVLASALAAATLLAAPGSSHAVIKQFLANLNSGQETPPTGTNAFGVAHLTYDTATKILCYSISYAGLSAAETTAHIHGPALPGVGPAVIVFPLPAGSPKVGCTVALTNAQQGDLFKNLYYVNIHTSAFTAGEIRGQILRIK